MNNIVRSSIGVACIALGVFFFRFQTDQKFAHVTPTEGASYLVPMNATSVYEQDVIVHNKLISRIGIYLMPLHPLLQRKGVIYVSLIRDGAVLQSATIDSEFIDAAVPFEVRFKRSVATKPNDIMKLRMTVSDGISGDIALRNRVADNDFSADDVAFYIDGVLQENPVAYTAFTKTNPAFIKQIGGLFAIFGIAILGISFFRKHALLTSHILLIAIAVLQAISAFASTMSVTAYGIFAAAILIALWWILRIAGRSTLAAFFGACIFAGSSWLPLLLLTKGGQVSALSMRDTLFDPNQIAVSHGAGAYVGFFAGFFALVGILTWVHGMMRMSRARVQLETLMICISLASLFFTFVPSAVQMPRASIAVAFCLAWFASLGLHAAEKFLGRSDTLIRICLVLLVGIAVLDLMHIAAVTFAYGI